MKVIKDGTEKTVFFEFSENSNRFLIYDNQKFWFFGYKTKIFSFWFQNQKNWFLVLVLVFGLESKDQTKCFFFGCESLLSPDKSSDFNRAR